MDNIVSVEWLKQHLRDVIVLDVSWASNKSMKEDYLKEHIPGAVFFDIMKDAEHTEHFPRNKPSMESFASQARSVGINDSSSIVLYDNSPGGGAGYFTSGRAWWLFKLHGQQQQVSVLDGGLAAWKSGGGETSTDVPCSKEGNFTPKYVGRWRKSYDEMVSNLEAKKYQVLDSRPPLQYCGNAEDPKTGHYPGAINIPFATALIKEDKAGLRPKEELLSVLKVGGVDLSKPTVCHCNGGMGSCTLLLVVSSLCDAEDVGLFHGGWTEWKNRATASQIEKMH